jgi:tetratricopeptide (TPR) repeat protein
MWVLASILSVSLSLAQTPAQGRAEEDIGARLERPAYDPLATSKTIEFWKKRTERDSAIALGWTELARAYLARHQQTGSLDDAVRAESAARRSSELHREPGALIILGRSLLSQHRFPEALSVAERAVRSDTSANALLCDVLIELGQLDRARLAFSNCPKTDPLDRIALEARVLEAQGDSEALIDRLRELCNLADQMPHLPPGLAAWYHVRLGHALIDRGMHSEGIAACKSALAIVPKEHAALLGLAEAAAAQGRWTEALSLADEAAREAPADFEAVHLISRAQSALGRVAAGDAAFKRLNGMVESSPRIYDRLYARACVQANRDLETALARAEADLKLRQDAQAYETLALVLERLGRHDQARTAIKTARALDPRISNIDPQVAESVPRNARSVTQQSESKANP